MRNTRQLMESFNPYDLAQPSPADNFLNSQFSVNNPLGSSLVQSQGKEIEMGILGSPSQQSLLMLNSVSQNTRKRTSSMNNSLKKTDSLDLFK